MSRASKYRHVFGQAPKKEYAIENVKVTNSSWDTNLLSASGKYISINWNASEGGAFAILPLPSPFTSIPDFPSKLPDSIPLARSHTAPVLDTDWSPHDDSLVASAGEDGKVMLWKVEEAAFSGWGSDGWVPTDFDPILRIDASPKNIGQVVFHPTASNVLASASGEHTVKLWDLANPENAKVTLGGHADAIQSFAFNSTGTLLVTTCRDRKLRLFDPRSGGEAIKTVDGHGGINGARVVWMGDLDRFATTAFSKMNDRQVAIWDSNTLANIKTITVDQSTGVIMPFWSDNNILFLAGKSDSNIRFYEYEADTLHALSDHKSVDPQRGMCFLPRRALNVAECEIARAYKVTGNGSIEPIGFIVPRKSDSFQSDIFPPAPSATPSLTAAEFFSGKEKPQNLVSLENGAISAATSTATFTAAAPVSVQLPKVEEKRYEATPASQEIPSTEMTRQDKKHLFNLGFQQYVSHQPGCESILEEFTKAPIRAIFEKSNEHRVKQIKFHVPSYVVDSVWGWLRFEAKSHAVWVKKFYEAMDETLFIIYGPPIIAHETGHSYIAELIMDAVEQLDHRQNVSRRECGGIFQNGNLTILLRNGNLQEPDNSIIPLSRKDQGGCPSVIIECAYSQILSEAEEKVKTLLMNKPEVKLAIIVKITYPPVELNDIQIMIWKRSGNPAVPILDQHSEIMGMNGIASEEIHIPLSDIFDILPAWLPAGHTKIVLSVDQLTQYGHNVLMQLIQNVKYV